MRHEYNSGNGSCECRIVTRDDAAGRSRRDEGHEGFVAVRTRKDESGYKWDKGATEPNMMRDTLGILNEPIIYTVQYYGAPPQMTEIISCTGPRSILRRGTASIVFASPGRPLENIQGQRTPKAECISSLNDSPLAMRIVMRYLLVSFDLGSGMPTEQYTTTPLARAFMNSMVVVDTVDAAGNGAGDRKKRQPGDQKQATLLLLALGHSSLFIAQQYPNRKSEQMARSVITSGAGRKVYLPRMLSTSDTTYLVTVCMESARAE
eukprot:5348752-Pleurochrysis_carterae.AAC.5